MAWARHDRLLPLASSASTLRRSPRGCRPGSRGSPGSRVSRFGRLRSSRTLPALCWPPPRLAALSLRRWSATASAAAARCLRLCDRRADHPGHAQQRDTRAQPCRCERHRRRGRVAAAHAHRRRDCRSHPGRGAHLGRVVGSERRPSTVPVVDESQPHAHAADGTRSRPRRQLAATRGIRRKPIDVSGVPGVTPEQEARATTLIEDSLKDLPKYADTGAAVADGYASIGDAGTGTEHYIKSSLIEDDDVPRPDAAGVLVYKVDGDQPHARRSDVHRQRPPDSTIPSLTDFAGPLMQWHEHGNLCWSIGADGKPRGRRASPMPTATAPAASRPAATTRWSTSGSRRTVRRLRRARRRRRGQAAVPEDQRIDMCSQQHDHARPAAAVAPEAATTRRSRSISAASTGVTPEQQAAAENLVAHQRRPPAAVERLPGRRGGRLPQHRRRRHRVRALHQLGLDQRRGLPRPRPPREPRLHTAARRPEAARRAMYMLPDTVRARPTCPTSAAR